MEKIWLASYPEHINSEIDYWIRSDLYDSYEFMGYNSDKYYIGFGADVEYVLSRFFELKFEYYHSNEYKIKLRNDIINGLINEK